MKPVNYNEISTVYDQRYTSGSRNQPAAALQQVIDHLQAQSVLEVGCGTGHWLSLLQRISSMACGLDASAGMLAKARQKSPPLVLTHASAQALPFAGESFDFIYCINALHHFSDPQAFIREARRTLHQGGAISLIGMDPHTGQDQWYLYDYFPGILETNLARYPSQAAISTWLQEAGFTRLQYSIADQINDVFQGQQVFNDAILQKNGSSQLALLSMDDFKTGMARIQQAVEQAIKKEETVTFSTQIALVMITGYL